MPGKSNNRRPAQVGEAIQRELGDLLLRGLKDPRLGFVTIMGVEVSPDLKHARVFVSALGSDEEQQASMTALVSARGWLRHELGQRLDLRYTPELQFRSDSTNATADRINRLLQGEIKDEGLKIKDEKHPCSLERVTSHPVSLIYNL